jgi:hypothetical protein
MPFPLSILAAEQIAAILVRCQFRHEPTELVGLAGMLVGEAVEDQRERLVRLRPPVVVRIAAEHNRSAMAGALRLSRLLPARGVPLPEIIAEGVNHRFSHLVVERLPGN